MSRSVVLQEKRGLLWGLCPSHDEDTPSFVVYEDTQKFYCYGCGVHGDVIDFISMMHKVNFSSACEILSGTMTATPILIKREPKIVAPLSDAILEHYRSLYAKHKTWDGYLAGARGLGVSKESFELVGAAWSPKASAFMFPQYDCDRNIIGFRFRNAAGAKWSLSGGATGLFIPTNFVFEKTVVFTEGPTDLCAALTLGFSNVIGRPSAFGGRKLIAEFIGRFGVERAVIVADNDAPKASGFQPGAEGAAALKVDIKIPCEIYTPPKKDFRASVQAGLTRQDVERVFE